LFNVNVNKGYAAGELSAGVPMEVFHIKLKLI